MPIMSFISSIFPSENERLVKRYAKESKTIFAFEEELKIISDENLKQKSLDLKARIQDALSHIPLTSSPLHKKQKTQAMLDGELALAFALCREASRRTLHMMHYQVQTIGGRLLHEGNIAEMRTGEGKTLVATLPVYLNALTGRGVHVVTVNDYLSRRDAVWMGQVYDALGMTVSVINHQSSFLYDGTHKEKSEEDRARDESGSYKIEYEFLKPISRKEAYAADITYGTNNEFGFDYLRDNITYDKNALVQRGHYYAVVDEIDSILIDEARTPLIISSPATESGELYKTFATIAKKLIKDVDYTVDEKMRAVSLLESGINKAEDALSIQNIYSVEGMKYVHHLETAVRAQALFIKEKEYVVHEGKIVIVDELTGRMQPGRRWSDGLHQAVEAKEGVTVEQESRTLASITFQNYFRFYEKLSGMTGTADTSKEEFYKVYALPVVPVPTHNAIRRKDKNDFIYQSELGKYKAVAKEVKVLHDKGQPVLIGTISIEKNELLSKYLQKEGIPHALLNAKNHEREGEIIAEAGKYGAVTIATNMAGRGVDIKLGGPNATQAEYEKIRDIGGLFVIGTERHEARRIDNQLRGRSGRQGDNGETQFFVSLEDDLMRVFGSTNIQAMMGKFGIPEDQPIESKMVSRALESAQEKIEGFHFDSRKHTLQYDDVLNKQRTSMYDKRRKLLLRDEAYIDDMIDILKKDEGERKDDEKDGEVVYVQDNAIAHIIEEKEKAYGKETFRNIIAHMALQVFDVLWMDHLDHMEHLRNSVNLRSYGQRDPLVEYKKEGLRMFKTLEGRMFSDMRMFVKNIDAVMGIDVAGEKRSEGVKESVVTGSIRNNVPMRKPEIIEISPATHVHDVISTGNITTDKKEKIGRNDMCPCGSGKKVKKCDCEEYKSLR